MVQTLWRWSKTLLGLSKSASWFKVASPILATGCIGHSVYSYQGTITAAPNAGHSFERVPNPRQREPIADAVVAICLDCEGPCPKPRETEKFPPRQRSDRTGHFAISELAAPHWFGRPDVTLCVVAEHYEPYTVPIESETLCGELKDDERCYVNVRLKPVGH